MKTQFLALTALLSLAPHLARANDATCLDNHEDQADKVVGKALTDGVVAMLAKKGISVDSAKTDFEVTSSQVNFESDGIYGYFTLATGSLTTKDGTRLLAELKQTSFNADEDATNIYLKPVLKSSGFDKEGNAINGHCVLVSDDVRVTDRADHILVTNEKTGRVIGRVSLPTRLSLY
ncbi:MAG: hypothetical protein ACXVB9_12980 [Bdellovibrionota bacterium]